MKMHPNLLREKFNRGGISKYLEFWKLRMSKDDIYARAMGPYVNYWENILGLLARALLRQSQCFWKAFGLQAIGGLIMFRPPFQQVSMMILKI